MTRQAGFSLIEVLAAVVVFAVVSSISVALLGQALRAKEQTELAMANLASAQRIAGLLRADMGQLVMRPARGEDGNVDPRLMAGNIDGIEHIRRSSINERDILIFTRTGWTNPAELQPRSTLQKVIWSYDGDELWRSAVAYPDEHAQTPRMRQLIAQGIDELSLEFLVGGQWVERVQLNASTQNISMTPLAVRVRYRHDQLGQMEHVLLTSQSLKG